MMVSLRHKVTLLLVLSMLLGAVLALVLNRQIVLSQFLEIEASGARHRLEMVAADLNAELEELQHLLDEFLARGETDAMLLDENRAWFASHLTTDFLDKNHLALAFVYDRWGKVLAGRAVDPVQHLEVNLPEFPPDQPPAERLLVKHQQPGVSRAGMVQTAAGPMLVVARPIESRQFPGMAVGTVVFGRPFREFAERVRHGMLGKLIEFLPFDLEKPSPDMEIMLDMFRQKVQTRIVPTHDGNAVVYRQMMDLRGKPLVAIKLTQPREIYQVGLTTIVLSSIITVSLIVLFGLITLVLLQRMLFRPLSDLTNMARGAKGEEDLSLVLPPGGGDEIGQLVEAFRSLSARLRGTIDGMRQEVRDRRRMESTLRHSEASYRKLSLEFRAVLNGIQDSLMLLDGSGHIVWANEAAVGQLNDVPGFEGLRAAGELHGRTLPENPDSPVPDCLRRREITERIERWPKQKLYGVKAFPITTPEGDLRVLRLSTDITEKIKLRTEATRSARLAALGELAAGVAHEINNPNAILNMNVGLLMQFWDDLRASLERVETEAEVPADERITNRRLWREMPDLLREMLDGTVRIQRIVDDLKHFVRDQHEFRAEPVDLNQVVKVAVRLTKTLIRKSTRSFQLEFSPEPLTVLGRQQQLEQIVINLLQNACQALTDPQQTIRVSSRFDPQERLCIVTVEDGGAGVAAEDAPHLFDPFFTTKREDGGTGLGLSVSFRIAQEHGGRLDFTSEPGRGSQFVLELPAYLEELET